MEAKNANDQSVILVPIDYSEYSVKACRYAAKIASVGNFSLCLMHAFYSPAFDLIELTGSVQTQQQLRTDVTLKLLQTEEENMARFIKDLFKYTEIQKIEQNRITSKLKPGLAKDEIIYLSNELKPFIVVMGMRGANKRNTSILGSITESAIKKLKYPVLAIPEDYEFIGKQKLGKIVYLTNYEESDFVSITKLMKFSRLFNMTIHCIHIGPNADQWEELKMQGLKDYFQKSYDNTNVECKILSNKPDLIKAVDEYVQKNNINIVALTHKKRNLIDKILKPSVAQKVLYHTNTPLLVFHS